MKLAGKTLLYSFLLAIVIILVITAYNIFLLPSLYVSYAREQNRTDFINAHQEYLDTRSYKTIIIPNPITAISFVIPKKGYDIKVSGKLFDGEVKINNPILHPAIDLFRKMLESSGEDVDFKDAEINGEQLFQQILDLISPEDSPIQLDLKSTNVGDIYLDDDDVQHFHQVSDKTIVMENTVSDQSAYYTNFFAITKLVNETIVSYHAVVTPTIDDIRPVMVNSLPLTILVVFLLTLLFSQLFSYRIIAPILKLTQQAETMRNSPRGKAAAVEISGKDEISQLAHSLNELYAHLQRNYQELEAENLRQEVFLRASSHELKTPLAASMLLVNGMIDKVGKFHNTDQYLPEVRDQVMKMQAIVDEMLSLNRSRQQIEREIVVLQPLVQAILDSMQVQILQKNIKVLTEGSAHASVYSDESSLKKILANLILNAVEYSPENSEIKIRFSDNGFEIQNPGKIEESLLPHIFEPFVSGSSEEENHGLGLYVSSYYARLLSFSLTLDNPGNQVITRLLFSNR